LAQAILAKGLPPNSGGANPTHATGSALWAVGCKSNGTESRTPLVHSCSCCCAYTCWPCNIKSETGLEHSVLAAWSAQCYFVNTQWCGCKLSELSKPKRSNLKLKFYEPWSSRPLRCHSGSLCGFQSHTLVWYSCETYAKPSNGLERYHTGLPHQRSTWFSRIASWVD